MKLKKKYPNKEAIPAAHVDLYEERDGEWCLLLEFEDDGPPPTSTNDDRVKEFRDRNIQLQKDLSSTNSRLEALQKQFGDLKPDEIKEYRKQLETVKEERVRELLRAGKFEEAMQAKYGQILDEKNQQIENYKKAGDEVRKKFDDVQDKLSRQATFDHIERILAEKKLELQTGAARDLKLIINQDWTTDESGSPVVRRPELIGENGAPMTGVEYVQKELVASRPHLFKNATGGGSTGSDHKPGSGGGQFIKRDPVTIGRNLKALAAGKVKLRDE